MAIYSITEAKPAPSDSKGPIHWLRANFFSSVVSSILTLFCFYIIYLIVPPLINWMFIDATWSGNKEEIVNEGARWIFIVEKINQFMYGFYPKELHWRPNTILVLAIVVGIILKYVKNNVIKMTVIALFPIISFTLIYGGLGLEIVGTEQWGGLMLTIIVASVGIITSFPIGILLALGRQSHLPVIRTLSIVFIEFVRGVPLITILFMASVVLPLFFSDGLDFNKLLRALIGIALFQAAYIAEVVRGGLQAIPKGQYEGADSIGLSYWQMIILVILPQALKISIPNLVGTSIALFKDSTLLLIIGLFDILAMVTLTTSDSYWLGFELEGYVFVTLVFWFFCFSMSQYSKSIERKFNTEH